MKAEKISIKEQLKEVQLIFQSDVKEFTRRLIECRSFGDEIQSVIIEDCFNITGSEVRDAVRELRREGIPIASNSKGYFLAKSYKEIMPTVENLEARALSMLKTSTKLKQCFNVAPTLFDELLK